MLTAYVGMGWYRARTDGNAHGSDSLRKAVALKVLRRDGC